MWGRIKAAWRAFAGRAPVAVPAPIVRSNGIFSTSIRLHRYDPDNADHLAQFLGLLKTQTFQRTSEDFKARDPSGALVSTMDGAEPTGNFKQAFNLGYYGIPEAVAAWYGAQSFIGYQMCAVLSQHWLVDKACSMAPGDAIRKGFDIKLDGDVPGSAAIIKEIEAFDRSPKFNILNNAYEFARHNRMYGIRVAIFKIRSADPEFYEKPFNPDSVTAGSYEGIAQIDPYWITPELDAEASADPASPRFYKPTWWRVNGKRYHYTHCIVIMTCDVADVLKPTYFYGGIPLPQRIYERVYCSERTANEAPQLALTKRTNVIKVDVESFAANQQGIEQKLMEFAYNRDNYGVKIIGTDEEMEQYDITLTDLDVTIMTQYQLVAAIAETPATKLLGTVPKGFNSTGEYDESNYHEYLESIRTEEMAPLIERHHLLVMRSHIAPKFGIKPVRVELEWPELDAETAEEKSARRLVDAQADKAWADTGAIDGIDIRERLIKDDESGYGGISAIEPDGPRPQTVVEPDAPKTAPNTPPGSTPTPAPAVTAPAGGA